MIRRRHRGVSTSALIYNSIIILIVLLLASEGAYAIDYPHNSVNNIGCDSCHFVYGNQPSLLPPWTSHVSQDIDDTQYNTLCWSCHNDIDAPYLRTHSSLQIDNGYGDWTVECRVCHNPHFQQQFRTYGSASYLYSGTSTGITTTTITKSEAGWTDNAYQGLVVFPNVSQKNYNYKIVSNTFDTLIVQGPINMTKVSTGNTFAIVFGKLINDTIDLSKITINPGKSGSKPVRFFRKTGANSFADGDATYNGICEVCHTHTTYHTNNGISTIHNEGMDCMQCHKHVYGFAHGNGGGGVSNDCEECHGHDAGYGGFTGGKGSYIAHSTHTENDFDDLRGPNIACMDCHETGNFPYFKSGTDINGDTYITLSETDVCDTCHSPGGTYDGVNDSVIGAKNNWSGIGSPDSLVYESNGSLKSGKEKWCAGCHDDVPSVIQSVSAPNVIGDEDAYTSYGIGYGFYKTGHGLSEGVYPATQAPAANKGCLDCHDSSVAHIDGESRTYLAASDNYQAGYRLKDVDGGPPMDVPRSDSGMPVSDFALCFKCHDSYIYLNEYNYTTNFRSDVNVFNGHTPVNSHWYHLLADGPHLNRWDSSWDGAPGDSMISCPACHNVHGSSSPAMVRHGELISTPGTSDKVPALDFRYTPADNFPTLAESTGGTTRFIPGQGTIDTTSVCSMCHNSSYPYTRTQNDMYPPRISFVYGDVDSNVITVSFSEGVFSDTGASGNLVAGDFTLTDSDNGRTILNVVHTAGNAIATIILNVPLDSSDDIGVDTLAAASTASIYDASGNPMAETPVVISGDSVQPSISNLDPANGAVDVALNENLTFILSDSGSGVAWTTFSIQLSGSLGYSKIYTYADSPVVSKTGTPSAYRVTVDPDVFFGSSETIMVTVNVDDLAGNSLTHPEWSFTAAGAAIWQTPDSVFDSFNLIGGGNFIDGDLATGNDFSPGGPNHYATYKLESGGDLYDVTAIRIYGGPTYTRNWKTSISKDGLTYTNIGQLNNVGGASQWYEYTFPSIRTARYIRIDAWHPGPESSEVAFEFQFKGTPIVNSNNAPSLSWMGEVNYTTDGVNPDSAIGGTDFEFRIKYADADNGAPSLIQVWIDENDSGTYESSEKYSMTETDPGDTDYTDGKVYTATRSILYAGDGNLNYRFVASDGTDPATGDPAADSQVIIINNAPTLSWTGEKQYTTDGVYPDSATSGNSFEFRTGYADIDNTAPISIQVWVDLDDSSTYEAGEKYDMTEMDSGDTVYTDGKSYSRALNLSYAGDGNLNYRFYASDGTDDAVGAPTSNSMVSVVPGSNIAPTVAWTGETNYSGDGVDPDSAIGGSEFVFRTTYADADNNAPAGIQVWVDEDDSGTYDADEKYDLIEADAGDTDYMDGKFYTGTLTLAHADERELNYCFFASDGTDVATGTPVFDSIVIVTNDDVPDGSVGYWKFEEADAASALDETVNLNDGTINGAARTAGIAGNGVSFDGTNDYVQVPDDDSLDLTTSGSIEVWAYKNTQKSYQMYVAKGHSQAYQLMDYSATGRIALRWGSDTNGLITDEVVPTGGWHHIVGTYDGSYLRIYIDGNLSKSAAYTTDAVANATPVRIGARDNGYYFDGIIDEVIIYDRALTDTEVQARYNLFP